MFYVIKDNILYEFGDNVNSAWEYPEDARELKNVTASEYNKNKKKYAVHSGKLVDISQTEEYLAKVAEEEKLAKKEDIQNKLQELDLKSIRAMREGGVDKDGIPFLEKYQSEIIELREEYNSL